MTSTVYVFKIISQVHKNKDVRYLQYKFIHFKVTYNTHFIEFNLCKYIDTFIIFQYLRFASPKRETTKLSGVTGVFAGI